MRDYEAIEVATGDGTYSMELALEFGGSINRLTHRARDGELTELVSGPQNSVEFARDKHFHGIPLYPFTNRLDGGCYYFRGKSWQLEINEASTNNSLHGFLYRIKPEVITQIQREHEAELTLFYRNDGSFHGYPFPADIVLTYKLSSPKGLSLLFRVINQDEEPVPIGIGWHPYFSLGQKVDELKLQLPPVDRIRTDDRGLPVGDKRNFVVFDRLQVIGAAQLDDCLELHAEEEETVTVTLWSDRQQKGIEFWQMANEYPFVHLFIPPDRMSIAIEPMSCGINAFNTGERLVVLGPGKVFSARCGVKLLS